MSLLNAAVGRLLDLILLPFGHLPPLAGLAVLSFITAVGVLLVFRATADGPRLWAVRRQLQAAIFEIRLFRDDVRAVMRALGESVRHQATYLRLTFFPAVCTVLVLAPVVPQLQAVYGYEGVAPGGAVLITAHLGDGFGPAEWEVGGVRLEAPAGLEVQTPAVWIPAAREVVWRVVPTAPGAYVVHVTAGGERISKRVDASRALVRRSPVRPGPGPLDELRYPVEPPVPAGGVVTALSLSYPERRLRVPGGEAHWVVIYAGLSMIFALAMRKRLRVAL